MTPLHTQLADSACSLFPRKDSATVGLAWLLGVQQSFKKKLLIVFAKQNWWRLRFLQHAGMSQQLHVCSRDLIGLTEIVLFPNSEISIANLARQHMHLIMRNSQ